MTHAKDIATAKTIRDMELPADPVRAAVEWRRRLNDTIVERHTAAGIRMPNPQPSRRAGFLIAVNYCFPHFFLLPTYSSASWYRIRPLGPEECLFEIWSLTRYEPGEEPPPPTTPTPVGPDSPVWPTLPEQDFKNLPKQQKGLHTTGFEFMRLSDKVEGLIGNYHRLIDGYLAGLDRDILLHGVQQVSGPIDSPVHDLGF